VFADPRAPAAGGLAVALLEALQVLSEGRRPVVRLERRRSPTKAGRGSRRGPLRTQRAGSALSPWPPWTCRAPTTTLLPRLFNGVLWPVFHYRLDLADFNAGYIEGYRRVNRLLAHKLQPLLRPTM
jgi:trehalose 6-phosphate synthase